MKRIEFFLCERGDLFVAADGAPLWCPYQRHEFWQRLRGQEYTKIAFDDFPDMRMEVVPRLLDCVRQRKDSVLTWLKQVPSARKAWNEMEVSRDAHA